MPSPIKVKNIDTAIAVAIEDRDVGALDHMLDELVRESRREAQTAFAPALEFKPAARHWDVTQEEGFAGDVAVATANKISRAKRRIQYELKVIGGFDGLRIVSDGDSWFQYPAVLRDIINVLSSDADKAILSVDGAGDEVAQMLRDKEYRNALAITEGHILLVSAGGNDLLGEGRFLEILRPFSAHASAENLVNEPVLRRRIDEIVGDYRKIVRDVGTHHPKVVMVGHGYDIAYPKRGGKWLGKPLERQRIPLEIGREIVAIVVDRFNDALAAMAREFSHYRHIDLRGRVGAGAASWHDELHPKNEGYARAADAFREVLAALAREAATEAVRIRASAIERSSPGPTPFPLGAEAQEPVEATHATVVIDPGHGGSTNLPCSSANNAVGPVHGLLEKNLTLDVSQRVKRIFERNGQHTCILTRDRDVNLAGRDRADVARRNSAAVFVSIHFNGSTRHNAQGTETFVHSAASNTGGSAELCRAVQASVRKATGLADRNSLHPPHFVKKAGFCVINPASHAKTTAAVLVEVSFLDRVDEEQRLTRDSYKDEIAEAIVSGIAMYLSEAAETVTEAPLAEVEFEDGVSFYAEQARISASTIARSDGERASSKSVSSLEAAVRLIKREAAAPTLSDGDDSSEFRRIAIGDAPDFASAAARSEEAWRIARSMFGDLDTSSFDFDAFGRFIDGLQLRHFSAVEFLFLGSSNQPGRGRCAGKNELPTQDLWGNIAKTARMLDEIRARLHAPINILSAYRNEAYNRCVGGEAGSLHMRFNAIDWTCASGTPDGWLEVARAVRASSPDFIGGIGFYPDKRFIHIDTRGREANW